MSAVTGFEPLRYFFPLSLDFMVLPYSSAASSTEFLSTSMFFMNWNNMAPGQRHFFLSRFAGCVLDSTQLADEMFLCSIFFPARRRRTAPLFFGPLSLRRTRFLLLFFPISSSASHEIEPHRNRPGSITVIGVGRTEMSRDVSIVSSSSCSCVWFVCSFFRRRSFVEEETAALRWPASRQMTRVDGPDRPGRRSVDGRRAPPRHCSSGIPQIAAFFCFFFVSSYSNPISFCGLPPSSVFPTTLGRIPPV